MVEEDFLILSDIHNYAVCPRRFALRAIEGKFTETWRTIDGDNMHKRAHDNKLVEKRGDIIIMRGLKISSHVLRVSGECDIVEFIKNDNGIELSGYEGKYLPFPIEYKRGIKPEISDCDNLQLCAQAMCLEEMLLCDIPCGALFYGEPHRRIDVQFTQELKNKVINISNEIHKLFEYGYTPKAKTNEFCNQCSLKDECITRNKKLSVKEYIKRHLLEEE